MIVNAVIDFILLLGLDSFCPIQALVCFLAHDVLESGYFTLKGAIHYMKFYLIGFALAIIVNGCKDRDKSDNNHLLSGNSNTADFQKLLDGLEDMKLTAPTKVFDPISLSGGTGPNGECLVSFFEKTTESIGTSGVRSRLNGFKIDFQCKKNGSEIKQVMLLSRETLLSVEVSKTLLKVANSQGDTLEIESFSSNKRKITLNTLSSEFTLPQGAATELRQWLKEKKIPLDNTNLKDDNGLLSASFDDKDKDGLVIALGSAIGKTFKVQNENTFITYLSEDYISMVWDRRSDDTPYKVLTLQYSFISPRPGNDAGRKYRLAIECNGKQGGRHVNYYPWPAE